MATKKQKVSSGRKSKVAPPTLPPGVKLVWTLRGHRGVIGRIAWSPDGRVLASPSGDKTIRLWDGETGECVRTLKGHKGGVDCVAFDPSGRMLASGGDDRTIRIWEVDSGRLLHTVDKQQETVYSIAFDRKAEYSRAEAAMKYGSGILQLGPRFTDWNHVALSLPSLPSTRQVTNLLLRVGTKLSNCGKYAAANS